jgi:nucleoside-diphosphate-sugar epimerase
VKVLLTGATGFIGAPVARELALAGHEVHAMVVPNDAGRARLSDVSAKMRFHDADLLDRRAVRACVADVRPDLAIHLAWYAVPADYIHHEINYDLVAASVHLAQKLFDVGCKRLVAAGTCFEYDLSREAPLREDAPVAPFTVYGACKLALFGMLRELARARKASFVWPRFFFLYGPHEPAPRLVPAVARALLGGERARVSKGDQVRDFSHVADAARAVAAVAASDLEGAVNVGSGEPTPVREVVRAIAEICGGVDRVDWGAVAQREGDPAYVCADTTRLRSTGFEPRFDLRAGLADAVAWWRAHG